MKTTVFGCIEDGRRFFMKNGAVLQEFKKMCRGYGKRVKHSPEGEVVLFTNDTEVDVIPAE